MYTNQIYQGVDSYLRRLDRVNRGVEAAYQIGDIRIRSNARRLVPRVAELLVLDANVLEHFSAQVLSTSAYVW